MRGGAGSGAGVGAWLLLPTRRRIAWYSHLYRHNVRRSEKKEKAARFSTFFSAR